MAGIRIITEDELFTYEGDGFKIHYRRIPNAKRGKIVEKHTPRGRETNLNAATIEIMEYCVRGWEGIYKVEGGRRIDLPYELAIVKHLPDEVLAALLERVGAVAEEEEAEAKNLPTMLDSNLSAKASTVTDVEQ